MSGPSPGQGGGYYQQDPSSFYDQQGQQYYDPQQQHNMNTVFEEEEPASSPELGRGDQQWGQEYDHYEQSSQDQYGYGQQDQQHGGYEGYGDSRGQGQGQSQEQGQGQQAGQEQWDPPYYPGYVYDAASNSYLPDPNWQPSSEDQATEGAGQGQAYAHDDSYSDQYGHHGQASEPQGQAEQASAEDSEDPYANDPYQLPDEGEDPYAQSQTPYAQPDRHEPYASHGLDSSSNDPYSQSAEPYAYSRDEQGLDGGRQEAESDPYAADSNPYNDDGQNDDPFGQNGEQPDPFGNEAGYGEQENRAGAESGYYGGEYDSYAEQGNTFGEQQDPYAQPADGHGASNDPYGQPSDSQGHEYGSHNRPNDAYGSQADPYSPTASQSQPRDPYAPQASSSGPAPQDPYGRPAQSSFNNETAQDPYAPTQQQAHQQPAQGAKSNPYSPRAAAPPPAQRSATKSTYAASPQQAQYSSFASVYDAAAQSDEPPYDPYAPVPKQTRDRAYSGASNLSSRSRVGQAHTPEKMPDPYGAQSAIPGTHAAMARSGSNGGGQPAYDPYSPPPPSSQPPPPRQSGQPQIKVQPAAAPPQAQNALSPTMASARLSAFSPPPRSTSAQSNVSSASAQRRREPTQATVAPPPAANAASAGSSQQAAPPRGAAGPARSPRIGGSAQEAQHSQPASAFDIPPPRQKVPPQAQRTQQRAPGPAQAPQQAPRGAAQSAQQRPGAPPASSAPSRTHESQQSTSSATSSSSNYIPPPPASAAPRAAPSSQRKPSPFGGVMQPPARRAPHQRGASAFGSDSPYGALPTGPLTSAYEPAGSGVEQIKEEEEEQEPVEEEQPQQIKEEQPEAEFVPSWMQATSNAPSSRGPIQPPRSNYTQPPSTARGSAPSKQASAQVDALSNAMGQVSLDDRMQQDPRRQAPPPARAAQQAQQAPRPPPQQQPPPLRPQQGGQGPPPPPPNAPRPQPSQQAQGPPPPSSARAPPPRGAAPPPRQAPPAQRPQQQQQQQHQQGPPRPQQSAPSRQQPVPQLHFEPPAGEREPRSNGPTRPPPPAGNGSRSTTPVPMMVVEETAEEEEQYEAEGQYLQQEAPSVAGSQTADSYAMDESSGYGEQSGAPTGMTTPSTTYGGDWQADGYDYVSGTHRAPSEQRGQQQRPYDPYAPQSQQNQPQDPYNSQGGYSVEEEEPEDAYTPSVPQQSTFGGPPARASPRKQMQQQQQQQQQRFQQPPPPQDARSREQSKNSYAPQVSDPYSPQAASTAPTPYDSMYGSQSEQQQQQPYDPYAAQRPSVSRQGSYANGDQPAHGSQDVADLGLERRTAPLVSFGLGGRMLVVFPDSGRQSSSAFDAANPYAVAPPTTAPSTPTTVHIRKLADVLPPADGPTFPGPMFLDGGRANAGKKRKEAFVWLAKRIEELEDEAKHAHAHLGFGHDDVEAKKKTVETKLLLVKLVKVFIENEGKLVGTAAVDEAVRAILAPQSASTDEGGQLPTADQLASAASQGRSTGSAEPFVTYGVSPADLDEMTAFLLRGERREAVKYALDHRMWAHAFIIASCVDTDCWKDVTVEFLRSELTPSAENMSGGTEGREALRVAYSMFAGLGAESIEQFVPPHSLGPQSQLLPAAPIGGATSVGNFTLSDSNLEKWRDTVGMIVANRTAGDSAALTALGDALAANGWIEAAHVCYFLSPQTSLVGGIGSISSRISLIGSAPSASTGIDLESVKLTELVEFGCSLAPTVKGQEAFAGFPHLQAYRLLHAAALADGGNVPQALKYTDAIVSTLKLATRPSPFYHPQLVAQVKLLGERLGAAPGQKDNSSWIARKVPRPTVNSLWSTFEGGFNKFVSGDGEPTPEQLAAKAEVAKVANGQPIGPFSHFSAISPASTSGTLSRAQSSTDLPAGNRLQAQPPVRPSSAAAPVPPSLPSPQSNKPVNSPGPPPVKRAPFKTHHARSSSLGAFAGYDFNPTAPPPWQSYTPPAPRAKNGDDAATNDDVAEKPKPQFAAVEDRFAEDESGLISPMAQFTPSVSPAPASNRAPTSAGQNAHRRMTTAEELADLGIGNSKSKKPAFDTLDEELEAEEGGAPPPKKQEAVPTPTSDSAAPSPKPDDKPTIKPSKSWLGGWFKREASPAQAGPGPVKANLGEQRTIYYDEKLKKWVNNSNKDDDQSAAVVPPPRAATASPSRAMRDSPRFGSPAPPVPSMPPQRSQTAGPPPLSRSATSSDLRSQSAMAGGDFRPPSRPPSAADGPTPGGARPGGARRNKPRYVVVPP
ncbi:hypothetical protein JCM10212_003836 [Sporobolomyces blumeae]